MFGRVRDFRFTNLLLCPSAVIQSALRTAFPHLSIFTRSSYNLRQLNFIVTFLAFLSLP